MSATSDCVLFKHANCITTQSSPLLHTHTHLTFTGTWPPPLLPIRCFSYYDRNPREIRLQQPIVWTLLSHQVRFMQIRIHTGSYLQQEKEMLVLPLLFFFLVFVFILWPKSLNVNFSGRVSYAFFLCLLFVGWLDHTHKVNRAGEDSTRLPMTSTPYFTTTALLVWLRSQDCVTVSIS